MLIYAITVYIGIGDFGEFDYLVGCYSSRVYTVSQFRSFGLVF